MKQKGSTLIIVLLLLVLMTLMAFALMRSTETATLISGNIASKQAAVQAGDVALVAAEKVLKDLVDNGTEPTKGYSSTVNANITAKNFSDVTAWSDPATLENGTSYKYVIDKLADDYYRLTIEISGQRGAKSYFEALYAAQ